MNKPAARLMATTIRQSIRVPSWNHPISTLLPVRSFSQTCARKADDSGRGPLSSPSTTAGPSETAAQAKEEASFSRPSININLNAPRPRQSPEPSSTFSKTTQQQISDVLARARNQPTSGDIVASLDTPAGNLQENWGDEPFHFHIYSHRRNTHITVTKPDRNPIISMSTGEIGFRKSKRKTFDAAYQLCAYVIDKLHQGNWHRKIHKIEVVLRGFGAGREAGIKVLLGNEGKLLKSKIVTVSDATRLKFGGTRSANPKRLG
ncbi:hypothetical protein BX600DRAFT_107325 [Xylariales sp. PMI_506]|nr:hypothetical protein BX600DRAFT_107325 [Xylariales sp. PMI_506]